MALNCRDVLTPHSDNIADFTGWKTNQGIKNMTAEKAGELSGTDPDYAQRDLYNAIAAGQHPSWTLHIQVMTFKQAEQSKLNPFDLTKVWPHSEFPLIPVGKMVLDTNPKNYFSDVEQIAFSPAHMVPGIEASPDKMLQGRLYSYSDTHRHRLGSNYLQLPVNCPFACKNNNYQRDGPQCCDDNQGGAPNYYPNSFSGPMDNAKDCESKFSVTGQVQRYNTADDDNYSQAGLFWSKVLSPEERDRLVENLAGHLKDAQPFLQDRAVTNFSLAHPDLGKRLRAALDAGPKQK